MYFEHLISMHLKLFFPLKMFLEAKASLQVGPSVTQSELAEVLQYLQVVQGLQGLQVSQVLQVSLALFYGFSKVIFI